MGKFHKTFSTDEIFDEEARRAGAPRATVEATFLFRGPFVPSVLRIEIAWTRFSVHYHEKHVLALDPGVKAEDAFDLGLDVGRLVAG